MTTIAYHHAESKVAFDSQLTDAAGVITTNTHNKAVYKDDLIFIMTGATCDVETFTSEYKKNGTLSFEGDLECSGLLLQAGTVKSVYIHEGYFCEELVDYNFAIGSGRDFALAALDFGKSAEDAVKYAMTRDAKTGGEVRNDT